MTRIPAAAPAPAGTPYRFPVGVKVGKVVRPIDPDTGLPLEDTLAGLGAWAPRHGDVAAATFAQEMGSGFYGD